MSFRALLMIVSALVCGASAAFGVSRVLQNPVREVEMAPVVEAAVDIPRGHTIDASELKIAQWPKSLLPEGIVPDIDKIVGRISLGQIVVGEPVLDAKLGARDAGRGLAAIVPKGMRAYTLVPSRNGANLGLSAALSVAGFILPGNKVDVLLNLRGSADDLPGPNGQIGQGSTTTLLQSIEVLAVDQRLDAPADSKVNPKDFGSVTLLVTPDQAAILDLGQNIGQLALSLRNMSDTDRTSTRPATLGDIRGHEAKSGNSSNLLASLFNFKGKADPVPATSASPAAAAPKEAQPEFYHITTFRGVDQNDLLIPVTMAAR